MDRIEVAIIGTECLHEAERMMVCAARLTQSGHKIHTMADFEALYRKPYSGYTADTMAALPHPTIQKFAVINMVIVGTSRRFLAQITRHQNEVKFMSASLQYSDYSDTANFVIPYSLLKTDKAYEYLEVCKNSAEEYKQLIEQGVDNDEAGYLMPQGLRNVLIISATPYQWKHMISQRVCRRNTTETRYVMLQCWKILADHCPTLFADCGPFCMNSPCKEGKMTCGKPISEKATPRDILYADFPKLEPQIFRHTDYGARCLT